MMQVGANQIKSAGQSNQLEALLGLSAILALVLMPLNGLAEEIARQTGWEMMILEGLEALLLSFFLVGSFWLGWRRRFFFSWTKPDFFLLAYLLIAGLSFFWSGQGLADYLAGVRYSAALFIFYFAARILRQGDYWLPGVKIALGIVAVVALGQFLAWWLIPSSLNWSPLAVRGLAGDLPRLSGSFTGPNQLATWLVLALLATLFVRPKASWLNVILVTLIIATFSRSALLGLIGGLLAVVAWLPHSRPSAAYTLATVAVAILLLLGIGGIFANQSLATAFNRSVSDSAHWQSPPAAAGAILGSDPQEIILGHGAGTAGPATLDRRTGLIAENWFLQITYEYGLAGLVTIVGFLYFLCQQALWRRQPELLAMTVAIIINALFLHPLSDNAAATLLFFIGAGSFVRENDPEMANA